MVNGTVVHDNYTVVISAIVRHELMKKGNVHKVTAFIPPRTIFNPMISFIDIAAKGIIMFSSNKQFVCLQRFASDAVAILTHSIPGASACFIKKHKRVMFILRNIC